MNGIHVRLQFLGERCAVLENGPALLLTVCLESGDLQFRHSGAGDLSILIHLRQPTRREASQSAPVGAIRKIRQTKNDLQALQ